MNAKIIVQIEDNEIIELLKNTSDKDERRKIIKNYLDKNIVGKVITKEFANNFLNITNTKTDNRHLVRNEHIDTSLSLTKVDDLIQTSEYIDEICTPDHKRNDYFWFFKTIVKINEQIFEYTLNIARSKADKHIMLYDITNYKKK